MYKSIYIPVDNSDYSNVAVEIGTRLATQFGARVIGSHAYAAKLHDRRFKQMEAGLPEEYHDETELERQRKIHDSLITRGLEIITDSYLDVIEQTCKQQNIPLERRALEGKNYKVIVEDILQGGYDLVVMGVLGVGAVKESMIGSVTERTIRRVRNADVFVVKETKSAPPGKIVVAVDGSHYSFGGFKTALGLAAAFNTEVEVVSAFDPYFHYAMFSSISGVLSEEAGKVFRFKEQEKLHEEVIDSGLAKIYQSHLEICMKIAEEEGIKIKTALLDGKPFEKVFKYVQQEKPWLLIVGRIGVHSEEDMDVGSNSENLVRMAPCNVLVSNKKYVPPIDAIAEYTVAWTEEASKRMERVPAFARGIAKTAVYRYALEKGFTIISNTVVDEAMGDILPKSAIEAMKNMGRMLDEQGIDRNQMTAADSVKDKLHEGGLAGMMTQIVEDTARAESYEKKAQMDFHICGGCGYTARGEKPVVCPICSADGKLFQFLDKAIFETALSSEGTETREVAYDGVPLIWTEEAKQVIRAVPAGFERRRAKAKVEKTARKMGFQTITKAFAIQMIQGAQTEMAAKALAAVAGEAASAVPPALVWTDEASERLARVPIGFMRDATRQHIENYAYAKTIRHITLDVAEAGIKKATEEMESVLSGATSLDDIRKRLANMSGGLAAPQEPSFYFCGMCGHVVTEVPPNCPVCRSKNKFMRMEPDIEHFVCEVCSQVVSGERPASCPLCGVADMYRNIERKKSELTQEEVIWSDAAQAMMQEIPEGMMREMTRWRIEAAACRQFLHEITPAVVEAQYRIWTEASRHIARHLDWDKEAETRVGRIPAFVRGTVIKEIESYAKEKGMGTVTAELWDTVCQQWTAEVHVSFPF